MVDAHRRLRASCFMEIAQELAGQGAEQLHMSDSDLAPLGAVWVLARQHVEFPDTPVRDQEVVLSTWHKGLKGVQYLRDYSVTDTDGRPLVLSTSSWIIMSLNDRHMLRPDVLEQYVPSSPQCSCHAVEAACAKIIPPKDLALQPVGGHEVRYSDVDYNGHTNNTKYIVWSLDSLPQDIVFGSRLKEFDINYNKESHLGETVSLYAARDGGAWYVEGRAADGQQCFIARFLMSDL